MRKQYIKVNWTQYKLTLGASYSRISMFFPPAHDMAMHLNILLLKTIIWKAHIDKQRYALLKRNIIWNHFDLN